MKTKITLRHENKVLKIDDTDYDEFPEEGDVIEVGDEVYRVAGVESAEVVLETIPEDEIDAAHEELEAQERAHGHDSHGRQATTAPVADHKNVEAPTREQARARTKQRLAAESKARVQSRKSQRVEARTARKSKSAKK